MIDDDKVEASICPIPNTDIEPKSEDNEVAVDTQEIAHEQLIVTNGS